VAHAETGDPGNGFGGQVFAGAQPQALQALEGGGVAAASIARRIAPACPAEISARGRIVAPILH
jgi:uncharacterized membrane protein